MIARFAFLSHLEHLLERRKARQGPALVAHGSLTGWRKKENAVTRECGGKRELAF